MHRMLSTERGTAVATDSSVDYLVRLRTNMISAVTEKADQCARSPNLIKNAQITGMGGNADTEGRLQATRLLRTQVRHAPKCAPLQLQI
jgi:hypothetical protein